MKSFLNLFFLFFFSCSNIVATFQKDMDADSRSNDRSKEYYSKFISDRINLYRRPKHYLRSNNEIPNSGNHKIIDPSNNYVYDNEGLFKKRSQKNDLFDKGSSGSLFKKESSTDLILFKKQDFKHGDILFVQVQNDLKSQIIDELSYAFKIKLPDQADKKEQTPEEKNKVFDKISSVIIENINDNHVLVRGRKYILFNKRKRLIEFEGLALKKAIKNDATINSNDLLESIIHVIK